jgi:hypothetical protein
VTMTKLRLDSDEARTRLGMCYALLIRLANEKAADSDTCQGDPEPAAHTGGLHRCATDNSTCGAPEQAGGSGE